MVENCATVRTAIGWNIVQAAGSYAQLAAVVGAVVFAGVVLLLGNPPKDGPGVRGAGFSRALTALPIVFISILVTAHLYTVLDGEQECERAFAIHISAAVAFQIAVLGLLLSLSWIFYAYRVDVAVLRNSNLMFVMLFIVSVFYLYVTVDDANEVLRGEGLDATASAVVASVLAGPAAIVLVARRASPTLSNVLQEWFPFRFSVVALFGGEMVLASIFAVMSDFDEVDAATFPTPWELIPIIVAGLVSGLFALHLPTTTRPAQGEERTRSRSNSFTRRARGVSRPTGDG